MPILIESTEGFMLMGEYVLEDEIFKILSLTVFLFIGKVDVEAVVEKSFAVKVVIEEDGGDFVEGFDWFVVFWGEGEVKFENWA